MAGGEGTRLRPITCDVPKPMAQVVGKPVMQYAVEHLKSHGITEIASTLHFLPDAIRNWFGDGSRWGVSMRYAVEEAPLGTAGSVRALRSFLNETFIVISGDALTDIDLTGAAAFHMENQSDVTLVLKAVESPVEFGVVIAGGDGRVERFLEKPAWPDVFSDTVNTGIYIIEPHVMDMIAEGAKADFARDLFPELMKHGARLFGWPAEGYWCDIGNPQQYASAQFDILDKRVRVDIGLPELSPGIFVAEDAVVSPGAVLTRPCAVLERACVADGAVVGPYAVVGRDCSVERGASLSYAVLQDGVRVGASARLERATVCAGAVIGERASLKEGAVVGAGARIGADAAVERNVAVWPAISIENHASVRRTQQRGSRFPRSLFGECGITGEFNDELSAENAASIAMALGSTLAAGSRVGVAVWGGPVAALLREAFDSGLLSTGVSCVDLGELALPAMRFAARRLRLDGAVHVAARSERVTISLLDSRGADIGPAQERKIEDALAKGSYRKVKAADIADMLNIGGISLFYGNELFGGMEKAQRPGTIGIYGPDEALNRLAETALEEMGYTCVSCSQDATLQEAARRSVTERVKLGLFLDNAGNDFAFIDEQGNVYDGNRLAVMLAMAAMDRGIAAGTVPLPVTANMHFEELATGRGVAVERTPAGRSDWLRHACHSTDERMCWLFQDGAYAAMSLMETLVKENMELSAYAARIPETFTREQFVECPLEKRGLAMKTLYTQYANSEALGGALVTQEHGRVFVTPDKQTSRFRVTAEALSQEFAEELAMSFKDIIEGIAGQEQG